MPNSLFWIEVTILALIIFVALQPPTVRIYITQFLHVQILVAIRLWVQLRFRFHGLYNKDVRTVYKALGNLSEDVLAVARKVTWLVRFDNGPLPNDVRDMATDVLVSCDRFIEQSPKATLPYMLRAQVNSLLKEFDKSLSDYNTIIALGEGDERVYYGRGTVHMRMERMDDAIRDFGKALEIKDDFAEAYNNRGHVYEAMGNREQALKDFDKAISLNLTHPTYLNRANTYYRMGNYEKAVSDCDSRLKEDPKDVGAQSIRSMAYLAMGKLETVIKEAQTKRGSTSVMDDKERDAIKALDISVLDKMPDPHNLVPEAVKASLKALFIGAKSQIDQDWAKAIEAYSEVLSFNKTCSNAFNGRAMAYNKLYQYEKGLADLDVAISLEPSAAYYNNRGWSYGGLGQFDKALEDCSTAIEMEPTLAWPYSNRALAYLCLGQYDKAIEDCTKAIELDPKIAAPYSNRGASNSHLGKFEEALTDLNKALEIDPKWVSAYSNRGYLNRKKGRLDEALSDLNRALAIDDKHFWSYYRRARVYQARAEPELAERDLMKLKEISTWQQHKYLFQSEP